MRKLHYSFSHFPVKTPLPGIGLNLFKNAPKESHRLCLRDFFAVYVAFEDIMMYNVGMPKDLI